MSARLPERTDLGGGTPTRIGAAPVTPLLGEFNPWTVGATAEGLEGNLSFNSWPNPQEGLVVTPPVETRWC